MKTRARTGQTGTAAIEFAILLPVLLLIIVGTLEWGRYFSMRESIIHAAREGARAGTLLDATDPDACDAAANFLTNIGITASCGSGITVTHPTIGASSLPSVECRIDVQFATVTNLPLGVPERIEVAAVMPTWQPPAP